MAQLEVPDKYASDLAEIARRDDKPIQDVVSEAMDAYFLFRFSEAPLTPAQLSRMQESLAQIETGDLVSEQEIVAFFDDWEKEAAAR